MPTTQDLAALEVIFQKFDPVRLTEEVCALGEAWADKNAAANALEETRKSVLAKLFMEHVVGSRREAEAGKPARPLSAAMAEQKALADEEYRMHLDLMVEARKASDRARVRYDMGKMRLELMRSLQATMRQELHSNR